MMRSRSARAAASVWMVAVVGTLTACGGDGDSHREDGGTGTPPQPATYSLTVQPHLGTLTHGLVVVNGMIGNGVVATGMTGPTGQVTLTIPQASCGPGMITVRGGPSAQFFDEATGQQQALGATEVIRALVPDICNVQGPQSVSMLDELLLHLPSQVVAAIQQNEAAIKTANEALREQLKREITAGIAQMKQELEPVVASALLLPADYARVLPTPISQPLSGNSALPSDTPGVVAATLHALRERQHATAAGLAPMSDNSFANFAALMAKAIHESRPDHELRPISDWAAPYVAAAVGAGFIDPRAADAAMDLGAVADRATVLMQAHMAIHPDEAARRQEIAKLAPVDSDDLTATVRAAALPLLLRAETPARLDEARTKGTITYACTVGERSQGEVTIGYQDANTIGQLDHGDVFTLDYRQCLTREPLSGLALARSGRMTVTYFAGQLGYYGASGQVDFDIALSSLDTNPAQPLLQASGMWTDWLAFGDPYSAYGPLLAGTTPLVRVDSQHFTMARPGGASTMTQGMQVRLDASADFGSGTGTGKAALKIAGMSMAVQVETPQPLVFEETTSGQRVTSGAMSLTRTAPVARQGSLGADAIGLVRVKLPDADGAETLRLMSMPRLMAHYLAL